MILKVFSEIRSGDSSKGRLYVRRAVSCLKKYYDPASYKGKWLSPR